MSDTGQVNGPVGVVGMLDGVPYTVRVHPDGQVDGSDRVSRLVGMHNGDEIEVPGHGVVTVDGSAEAVFGLLLAHTEVYRVDGTPPDRYVTAG